jgi:predicted transcriptional regulator
VEWAILVNYRSRLDIIAAILNVAAEGGSAKKTQIMYQANLSFNVLQRYISELSLASLISFERQSHSFVLTTKGQEFLRAYKVYSKSNQHVEKRLGEVAAKRKVLEQLCSPSQSNASQI